MDGRNAFLVSLAAFLLYANSLGNGHVYDDVRMIGENPRLDDPWDLRAFFGTSYWGDDSSKLYRPLAVWSFALDRAVFGPGPSGVHLVNVLGNAVVGALAYALVLRLLGRRDVAFLAALLFSFHPVHTEAVANGVGRSEIHSTALVLGALLLHLAYAERRGAGLPAIAARGPGRSGFPPGRPPAPFLLAGALALYFLALLFKESAVTAPALAFLMEGLLLEEGRFLPVLRRFPRFALYAIPLGLCLAIRVSVIGAGTPAIQEVVAHVTGAQRFFYANETILRYVGQLLFPLHLCGEYADYTRPIASSPADPLVLTALLAWPVLGGVLFRLLRRGRRAHVFAVAWFFATLLPVSNLLFAIGTVRADRLLYLPSLGFALLLGLLFASALHRSRLPACACLLALLGFYGWRTVTRNLDWRSPEAFWPVTVRQNPGSAVGWAFLGDVARARRDHPAAEAAYRRSFEFRDGAGFFYPESHNNYARMLHLRGDRAGAEAQYRLVVRERPGQHTALVNLGELLLHEGRTRKEAIGFLERAVGAKPEDFRAYANLALAYRLEGQDDLAIEAAEKAISREPNDPDLWTLKAQVLDDMGRTSDAAEARRRAERLRGR